MTVKELIVKLLEFRPDAELEWDTDFETLSGEDGLGLKSVEACYDGTYVCILLEVPK